MKQGRRLALVLVVGAGILVVPAAPASAAFMSGVTIVSAVSATDSIGQKDARVSCPDDTVVVGAGASIGYTAEQVHITGVVPSEGSVTAYASEDDTGYLWDWYVKVTAVCAVEPSGYEIVSDYHIATSDPSAAIGAYCPEGKVMLGGTGDVYINNSGWAVPRNIPDVALNQLLNSTTSEGLVAYAYEDANGTTQDWILKAYAICANPVPGLQTVYSWGGWFSDDTRYDLLTCPAGTRVLGVGGHVFNGTGEVSLTSMIPGRYGSSDFVIVEAAEDQDGLSTSLGYWRMDAWAKCAPTVTIVRA